MKMTAKKELQVYMYNMKYFLGDITHLRYVVFTGTVTASLVPSPLKCNEFP